MTLVEPLDCFTSDQGDASISEAFLDRLHRWHQGRVPRVRDQTGDLGAGSSDFDCRRSASDASRPLRSPVAPRERSHSLHDGAYSESLAQSALRTSPPGWCGRPGPVSCSPVAHDRDHRGTRGESGLLSRWPPAAGSMEHDHRGRASSLALAAVGPSECGPRG